jgi:glucose-6-phosphate 1-dehydrogenase
MSSREKPTVLVVFGISGDLAGRYLLPALSTIKKAGQLPENFEILGLSRRRIFKSSVLKSKTRNLSSILTMQQLDMQDIKAFAELKKNLIGKNVIFYLAIPPSTVPKVISLLGKAGLNTKNIKLLLEKPFGTDLASARLLVSQTVKYFSEDQIYRIDHFLAKEVAQNLTVFLGRNALFRNVWNGKFIERIEIVAAEQIGIEGRSDFYEQTGALRDLLQSHLMQLAALTLMEPCDDVYNTDEIANRRKKALSEIMPVKGRLLKEVKRAQYSGYKQEVENPSSRTETYVRLRIACKNHRWKKVPIILATGKALNDKLYEIRVFFKATDLHQTNRLRLRVQPREGFELDIWVKEPGYERKLQSHSLSFAYNSHFKRLPDAYEQVLLDVVNGVQALFASNQEVIDSWRVLQPVLDLWQKDDKPLPVYQKGLTLEEVLKTIDQ